MRRLTKTELDTLDPMVEVGVLPLNLPDGTPSQRMIIMVDPEGLKYEAGYVSTGYNFIHNRVAHEVALDVITRTGHKFRQTVQAFNGKQYRERYVFSEINIEPKVGEIVNAGLDVWNSYDGSFVYSMGAIAVVQRCLNGMIVDKMLGGYRFRHYGDAGEWKRELDESSDNISRMLENLPSLLPHLRAMTERGLNLSDVRQITRDIKDESGSLTGRALMVTEEDTAWGFYNGYTNVLTKQNTVASDSRNREISNYFIENWGKKE